MPILIRGKSYTTVAERLQAFNETYKNGSIQTEVSFEGDYIRAKTTICPDVANPTRVFVGHAEELRGSTMINKTNPLENLETSAVGRALGMMGLGSSESVASADEVELALEKQGLIETEEDPFTPNKPEEPKPNTCEVCGKSCKAPFKKCSTCKVRGK